MGGALKDGGYSAWTGLVPLFARMGNPPMLPVHLAQTRSWFTSDGGRGVIGIPAKRICLEHAGEKAALALLAGCAGFRSVLSQDFLVNLTLPTSANPRLMVTARCCPRHRASPKSARPPRMQTPP